MSNPPKPPSGTFSFNLGDSPIRPSYQPPGYDPDDLTPVDTPAAHSTAQCRSAIDPDKLYTAWESMVGVLRELIAVVARAEEDNAETRRDNARTRKIVVAALLVSSLLMACQAYLAWTLSDRVAARETETKAKVEAMNADVAVTLRAIRAASVAIGARTEADSTTDPAAREAARLAGLRAQVEALAAEKQVSPSDPGLAGLRERIAASASARVPSPP